MAGSSKGKYYGIWRKKSEGRFCVNDVREEKVRYQEYQRWACGREEPARSVMMSDCQSTVKANHVPPCQSVCGCIPSRFTMDGRTVAKGHLLAMYDAGSNRVN